MRVRRYSHGMQVARIWICCLFFAYALAGQEKTEPYLKKAELPNYPAVARQARLSGIIRISFAIGQDGSVSEVKAVSGHPMLTFAAVENVKTWRFGFSGPVSGKQNYYTEFVFRLSGKDVKKDPRLTVSLESFRHVEITTDVVVIPDSPLY
jgi:TonB family protein